ncbi:MAG: 7-cyano-7-deazaguanine synthase [Phycisphaeraceae bacterium]
MSGAHWLILGGGGLRALVATALIVREHQAREVAILHVRDGRPGGVPRAEHARLQAEHFGIKRFEEQALPSLFGPDPARAAGTPQGPMMRAAHLLGAGVAHAALRSVDRVLWPTSCNAEAQPAAVATEQMLLVGQLAGLEAATAPRIEAPLLELADTQVIELGSQLGVPWELARSCLLGGADACRACSACLRRKHAFARAGIDDPIEKPMPAA